jgi:hypothetical protein
MQSDADTVEDYLAELPEDRRATISAVRDVVNENLPAGYRETMAFGMIGWGIPLEDYPDTYNGQPLGIAALASQKNLVPGGVRQARHQARHGQVLCPVQAARPGPP